MEKSRVLIVDDIEENLKVLTETLTQEGFHPLQAKSGERAIQIAKKAEPDLILLDIKMPGMSGYDTINILKSDPITKDIPVIFISALNQIEDKILGFKSGAVDYVSKPFQREEVIARVTTHLKLRQALKSVEVEQEKTDRLLKSILPQAVAEELKSCGHSDPQSFSDVSIIFTDIVNFTKYSGSLDPRVLIDELNSIFTKFDDIMEEHNCERIKTVGDAYLGVCGLPNPVENHGKHIIDAATDFIEYLKERNKISEIKWEIRVGVHSGNIVGGIVGKRKYIYDIFGDNVNVASRMETNSEPMKINISQHTYDLIKDYYRCEKREEIEVKGKGLTSMYFVTDKIN